MFRNKARSFQALVASFASLVLHCPSFRVRHNYTQAYSLSEISELRNVHLDAIEVECDDAEEVVEMKTVKETEISAGSKKDELNKGKNAHFLVAELIASIFV